MFFFDSTLRGGKAYSTQADELHNGINMKAKEDVLHQLLYYDRLSTPIVTVWNLDPPSQRDEEEGLHNRIFFSLQESKPYRSHTLFIQFNGGCETLYQFESLSMNNHLHIHLENMEDFSVPHAYWLFACERFKRLLLGMSDDNSDNIFWQRQ